MFKLASILIFSLFTISWANATCGIGGSSGGSKATWDEIMSCPQLLVNFPTLDLDGRQMHYNEVCVDGEKIRSKNKVPMDDEGRYDKKMTWFDYVFVDRVHEVEECVEWDGEICVQTRMVTIVIPLKSAIEVYRQAQDGQWILFFTKDYELPICADK